MMNVYILVRTVAHEGDEILGVFATDEAAQIAATNAKAAFSECSFIYYEVKPFEVQS